MNLTEFLKKNPANSPRTFGKFIKQNREEMGLSCRAFAIELNISAVYLCDIEKGNRPVPANLLEIFKEKFSVIPDEEQAFYDLASITRKTIQPELIQYLIENPEAREAIRLAREKNLKGKDLLDIVQDLGENLTV